MARPVRLAGSLAAAAVVLSLTTVAFASSGGQPRTAAPRVPASAAEGLGSAFASGSGTCDPTVGQATFVAHMAAGHSDPIATAVLAGCVGSANIHATALAVRDVAIVTGLTRA